MLRRVMRDMGDPPGKLVPLQKQILGFAKDDKQKSYT
jgi:hypothetical protein